MQKIVTAIRYGLAVPPIEFAAARRCSDVPEECSKKLACGRSEQYPGPNVFYRGSTKGDDIMKIRTVSFAIVALMAGNMAAFAQDPPGSAQQDRSIREELGRGTVGQGSPDVDVVIPVVPLPVERRGPPPGRYYGDPPEPPGGDWQDKGNNEEAGNPPGGERR